MFSWPMKKILIKIMYSCVYFEENCYLQSLLNKILKFIVWIEISLPFSANIFLLQHLPLDHRCQSSCHLWRKFVISKFNVELTLLRRMDGQQCIIICLKTGVYLTFNKENILELSMRQVFGKMCLVNKYTTGPMLLTWKVTETWT